MNVIEFDPKDRLAMLEAYERLRAALEAILEKTETGAPESLNHIAKIAEKALEATEGMIL